MQGLAYLFCIYVYFITLGFIYHCSMLSGNSNFSNNHFFIQLTFLEYIARELYGVFVQLVFTTLEQRSLRSKDLRQVSPNGCQRAKAYNWRVRQV